MTHFQFLKALIIPVIISFFGIIGHAQTTVQQENFEGGTYVVTPGGVPAWSINTTLQVSGTNSYQNVIAPSDSSWIITDVVDLTGYNFVLLDFQHICKIEFSDSAEIFISIDNGVNWTKLTSTEYINTGGSFFATNGNRFNSAAYLDWLPGSQGAVPDNTWWREEQFNVSSIAANQSQVRFKFRMKDGNGNGANLNAGWFLDDIMVIGSPFELIPPSITMIPPIIEDTVFGTGPFYVSATITDNVGIEKAYLIYTVNTVTDTILMANSSGDIFEGTIPSQSLNTHVDYYISAYDSVPASNETSSPIYWFFTKKTPSEYIVGTEELVPGYTLYSPIYRYSSTSTTSRSLSVVVYTQAELLAAGIYPGATITKLAWDKAGAGGTNANPLDFNLYMRNSTVVPPLATTTTWQYVLDNFTLKYSNSNYQVPAVSGWHELTLTTPFVYTGGSIEIATSTFFSGTQPWTTDKFDWKYSSGTATSIIAWVGSTVPTGATILSASTAGYKYRPNTKFFADATVYTLDAGVPSISSPTGTQITGVPTAVEVYLKNWGTDTLISADIQYSVNGIVQGTFPWTGWLTEDMVAGPINIGNATFVDGSNELKVWSTNPNVGVDLNNINDTAIVNLYSCQSLLSGTYTIDSSFVTGGTNFHSFEDALLALTNCGVNGPVVFELHDPTYNLALVLNEFPGVSATNTITFKPASTKNVVITTASTTATIKFNAAKYIIFDGSNDGTTSRNLTIRNTSTATNTAVFWLSSIGALTGQNCSDITIKNCNIQGGSNSVTSTFGIYAAGTSISTTGTGNNNHNITISNNSFTKAYYAIYARSATNFNNGLIITNNSIGSTVATDYVTFRGVDIQGAVNPIVHNNTIFNLQIATAVNVAGIDIGTNVNNAQITSNVIFGLRSTSTSGYGAYGINISSGTGVSDILIANNMIYDIITSKYSTTSTTWNPFGIRIIGGTNIKVYYNSINLYGEPTTGTSASMSACLMITAAVTNLDVRNNIFANSMTGNAGSKSYAVYKVTAVTFAESNFNDYYPSGTFGFIGYSGTADVTTLAAWQTVTTKDINSVTTNPQFFSQTNLHTSSPNVNNIGTPIPTVTTDIDGEIRHLTSPDIGADEFTPPAIDANLLAITYPAQSACGLTNSEFISILVKNLGDDTITTIDASYKINALAPVTNTFIVSIPKDSTSILTFTTPADLSAFGIYNISAWIDFLDDAISSNDSVLNYKVRHAHDFYASDYTQGFESTEYYADWTIYNQDASAFKWEIPYSGSTYAHTGTFSARFNNAGTNTGQDWMFTRCFTMQAGETFDLSFWYRSSSTASPSSLEFYVGNTNTPAGMTTMLLSLPGIISTTHNDTLVRFVAPADGTYYFGWKATTTPSTILMYIDDINITLIPSQEAAILSSTAPVAGCDLSSEQVSITIQNTGADAITGGLTANYQITGSVVVVSEPVDSTITPGQILTFNFATLADLTTPSDSVFEFTAWIDLLGDPITDNDTIIFEVESHVTAPNPITTNDTINYGEFAELTANTGPFNKWFADSLAISHIFVGDTFTTPVLFNTTTYWVEASYASPAFTVQVGSGTTTSTALPTYGLYDFSWGATIYKASNMNFSGSIDTIYYQVSSTTPGYTMIDQRIYMKHVTIDVNNTNVKPDPLTFTEVYTGDVTWVGPGWVAIALEQPFQYNGTDNLMVFWENWDGDYVTGYPTYYQTTDAAQTSCYGYADTNFPTGTGTYSTSRPNIRFVSNPFSCPSERVPAIAVVNLPAYEPVMVAITSPVEEECSNNANLVSILITNLGTDTILSGLTASYVVDGGVPVAESVTTPVAPGDTIPFTFATPIILNLTSGDSTISIVSYVDHAGDPYQLNDTLSANSTFSFTAPMPLADNDTIPYATQATLSATSPYMLRWYDSPTSDVVLDTGAVYVTPILYANTPYYVGASEGMGSAFVGAYDYSIGTSSTYANTTYYLIFDVLEPSGITIKNIDVFPSTAPGAAFEIQLLDNGGTVLQSYSSTTTALSGQRETVPVDFDVPFGTSFRIKFGVSGGFWRNTNGATYPYTIPNVISITGNSFSGYPEYYYFFYNWEVGSGSGCESDRAEVWAIIDTLPALDAGVVSIDAPTSPTNLQAQDVKVTLQNFGTDTITSVDVNWTINGIPQLTYNWVGTLPPASILSDVTIGNVNFFLGMNDVVAWTSNPNSGTDFLALNDTAFVTIEAYEPLCGIYHIGGSSPDFATFTEAVYGLENWGISCPVTFIVEPGVYNEQIRITEIDGADATNTITFIGNGNAVLSYAPSISAERYVLKLDTAKYIRFEDLTIEAEASATYGFVVHMMNGCEDIQFTNCTINTNATSTSTNYAGIVGSGSATSAITGGNAVNNLLLDGNTINGGYYGIVLYSTSANPMSDHVIINNTLNDFYYYGTYVYYNNQPIVSSNTFNGRTAATTSTSARAIHFAYAYGPWEISKNNMNNLGLYGVYLTSCTSATTPSIVVNNMIAGGFTSTSTTAAGLYVGSSDKINIWNNSINFDGLAGRSAYILATATNIDFRNNSLAFTGTGAGYAEYSASVSSFTAHDYNNYYSTGANFVFYGLDRADLATLQSVNLPAGNDLNSQVGNPFYYSATNLHASTTQLWGSGTPIPSVIDDIDGDLRDPVNPAIGADEYTPANIDAAVVQAINPSSGCGLSIAEIVSVEIKNLGLDTIFSMNISYSINGGTPVTELWNDTLTVGQTTIFDFTTPADLSGIGTYTIFYEVDLVEDAMDFNDTLTYTISTGHDFYNGDYTMGFEVGEDYSQWTVLDLNSDARTWEPGYNSTTYAHTGSKSARFFNNSAMSGDDYLFTECFTLDSGTAYRIDFWYRVESATYPQNTDLIVSTDVTTASIIDTLLQLQLFTNTVHQQASAIFTPDSDGVYYFGWYAYSPLANWYSYIDDINIRILAPYDAGVIAISNVDDIEDGGSNATINVSIQNFGSQTLTSVPVNFTINGGTPITETWTGSLDPDAVAIYSFTTPFTVPDGDYTICAYTSVAGDGNPGNDETCVNKYGLPVLPLPHTDDFEGTTAWYLLGTSNGWQFGTPSASVINSAYSPTHAWATVLAGNYLNNSSYYLYTPKFDFSNVTNMMMGFQHWIDTENGVDGGKVQWSTDGNTWTTLGILNDPNGTNWYNAANINNAPGFSGTSGGWQYSEISLSAFNFYAIPVQFRFHFFSNASVTANGWAIDDFEIFQPQIPNDAGVIAIEAPVTQSITGAANQVTVRIKNFGTNTLTSIPLTYRVYTGMPPVSSTWTGSLAPGAETSFTFPQTYIGPFQATYDLCAWSTLATDIYTFNDTSCVSLDAGPANTDATVTEIISPTGSTWAGQIVTVTIKVKNNGLLAITNVPVQFSIDGVPQTTEIVVGTLNPGAETNYTFITTFVAPAAAYELCAKTSVSGDAIITNDQLCSDMIVGLEETEYAGYILMQNIPNPADDQTNIGFSIPTAGKVVFTVTNVLGEVIYSEFSDYNAGKHQITLNTKNMAAGIYYYSIAVDNMQLTRKMIKQ